MANANLVDWYIKNQQIYKRLSNKVESFLVEYFEMNSIGYHMVTSRAKDIESVRKKGIHQNTAILLMKYKTFLV